MRRQFLNRQWRTPSDRLLYTGLELLAVALLAVALARAVWAAVTPIGPVGDWPKPVVRQMADPAVLRSFDPFVRGAAVDGPVAVTSLDLRLLGTRVDEVSGRGSAIIEAGGLQSSFAVGMEIVPGARLAAVDFDSVTIERGGARETLYLDQSGPAAP